MTARISLEDAARQCLGDERLVSWLRRKARDGKLAVWKIGREYKTTPEAVEEMVEQCRVSKKESASGFAQPCKGESPSGSSETEPARLALAALRERAKTIEECAQLCEVGVDMQHPIIGSHTMKAFHKSPALAAAIRALGEKHG